MKAEKEQAQPQLYGTSYLLVKITLTGPLRSGKAQAYFSVPQIAAVIFPTTAGQRRVEQMRKWTVEVLTELRARFEVSDLFLFSVFDASMPPEQLFLQPIWATPNQAPVTLLGE